MVTLLIFGSLTGDICIVLTPRKSSIPNVPTGVPEKFKKNQGLSPIGRNSLACFDDSHGSVACMFAI
jgi:hypothetical protein